MDPISLRVKDRREIIGCEGIVVDPTSDGKLSGSRMEWRWRSSGWEPLVGTLEAVHSHLPPSSSFARPIGGNFGEISQKDTNILNLFSSLLITLVANCTPPQDPSVLPTVPRFLKKKQILSTGFSPQFT